MSINKRVAIIKNKPISIFEYFIYQLKYYVSLLPNLRTSANWRLHPLYHCKSKSVVMFFKTVLCRAGTSSFIMYKNTCYAVCFVTVFRIHFNYFLGNGKKNQFMH
jgi:hypothetical protein